MKCYVKVLKNKLVFSKEIDVIIHGQALFISSEKFG